MKHIGYLKITEENQDKFKKLKEVTGNLDISSNTTLPALTSVDGHLDISSNTTLPALTSIDGYLYIRSNATLQADALTSVGGYLDIRSNATLQADALTSIGNLYIRSNATLQADALTSVDGYLDISSNTTLPALTSVGYLDISSNTTLPALTSVDGHLDIRSNAPLQIPSLKNVKWKSVDRRLFVIESSKNSRGIKIYSGYNLNGIKNNKHIKESCFVVEKEEFYAHGLTVKKAIQDLQFKIASEKLKHEPIKKDTLFTVKYYRLLTGSCDHGCRSWMEQNKIPFTVENDETVEVKPIRADELLPLLEKSNAYGIDKIKRLITFDYNVLHKISTGIESENLPNYSKLIKW